MARERSPARDEAFKIYKEHKGEITNREIANKLGTPEKTISGWKVKDKWNDNLNGVLQKKIRSTPKENSNKKSTRKESIADEVKEVMENDELTDKQRLFCDEYLIDFNATQAAIRAGYSEKTAYRTGADNLKKPQIQTYIEKRMKDREVRTEITQDKVLQEFAKIGFSNVTDYVEVENKGNFKEVVIKATADIPKNKLAAIASIKEGANGIEIKLHDKVKALEDIGRHLGMFTDKVQTQILSDNLNVNVITMTAEERQKRIEELKKKLKE